MAGENVGNVRVEQLLRENEELRRRLEDAEATVFAIRSGQVDAFVVTRDHKESVFTLETADRPYRLFVESMQEGALTLDTAGTILFCNEFFANLLKMPTGRLAGTSLREFIAEGSEPGYDELLTSGNAEVALKCADGSCVTVHLMVHSLNDAQTETLCMLARDLTVQKHYEELKRTQAALRETEQRLMEADRRKDEFLATLAHELRNPLAPIRTGLEVMKMTPNFPKEVEEIREIMERQTQQMVTLIDDLLDVSRITRGKLHLRKQRVELRDVLRSALEAAHPMIEEAGHRLTVSIPDEPLVLDADPHRLAQVVANLLNNAVKYTKNGGRIELEVHRHEHQVQIAVQDNGVGIPREMQESVFEMFTQVDKPLDKGHTGLGIGLTLAKSLVEMHGGRISVQSDGVNQGSRFTVQLPLLMYDAAIDGTGEKPTGMIFTQVRRRVLVVDDNKSGADVLSTVVQMMGHEVRTAYDGVQGIEAAESFRPDVILMDLGMPNMNGHDAARHIRSQLWGKDMVLVALTGWGQLEDRRRTKEVGFDHHLVKPAETEALAAIFADIPRCVEARAALGAAADGDGRVSDFPATMPDQPQQDQQPDNVQNQR